VGRERQAGRRVEAPPIERVSRDGDLPLSFAQQRLWFIQQLEPESAAYNIPRAVRLRGELEINALGQSLGEVVRRHEALRTRIVSRGGQPIQVIDEAAEVKPAVWDLSEIEEGLREKLARQIAAAVAGRPFDLERDAVWRAALMRMGAEDHVLMLCLHHVASDGWSNDILVREFGALYEACRESRPSPLPELAVQYADYAVWQREWLQGEALEEQLSYWRRRLADVTVLELPTDRPRPIMLSDRSATLPFTLSVELTQELKALSRQSGTTLFITLFAAFQTFLGRYSGQDEVTIGAPIANRNRLETEGLIGLFVNQLILRTDLSGNPSFRELLRRVREITLEAYEYQDLPFEKLVEELAPERDLSRSPLSQIEFVLQNASQVDIHVARANFKEFGAEHQMAKFDLSMDVFETEWELSGALKYRTDLFDAATIERMLGNFSTLLKAVVVDPDIQLSELSLLTKEERNYLLYTLNATDADYPLDYCIHELFEAQAERMPNTIAAIFQDRSLTYEQLNRSANYVAGLLRARGIGNGSYVPVLLDRSLELVVSLLAVMKAGAAFSPLDINWPVERLRMILDDIGSKLILVNKDTPYTEEELGRPLLLVNAQAEFKPTPNLNIHVRPLDPIYVIYTSGSTGQPKGVMAPHRGITNRFCWMNEYLGVEASAVALQTTRHVYDAAVWQLFWPLINGGSTIIPSADKEMNAHYLTTIIGQYGVTIADFVPSVFNSILPQLLDDAAVQNKLSSLRCLIIGGEEITPATTYTFMDRFPWVNVVNLYGPTEASIGCIAHKVCGKELGQIPIGKPISNAKVLILDRYRKLVPLGVTGEIYLTGVCLGLGYLNDEERTGSAFINNPFPEVGYGKLYKTGDMARQYPDGIIKFIGRIDDQVKIRGLRIELSEIETALRQIPDVRQAVVVVREVTPGEKRLVAYIVPQQGSVPTSNELREYLQRKLPNQMVPTVFVRLEELPLTPNGKLDRKALPAPEAPERVEESEGPRTAIEEIVAGIWREVLRLERVGMEQNFFELGGHSLLATQVISRVRDALDVEMPLRVLFESPTVGRLAEVAERERQAGRRVEAPPIVRVSRDQELPLSFAQQRLWFMQQLEPESAAYNIPEAVRLLGELEINALGQSLGEVVRRHEALRTRFVSRAGRPVQIIDEAAEVKPAVWDLSEIEESLRERLAKQIATAEAARPFDLERDTVWRAALMRMSEEDHVLLLCLHHVASDGWSTDIMVREFNTLYEAYRESRPSSLPELQIQYADYAVWQREWLQGEVLEEQLGYWQRQLSGVPELELPTDRPRPSVPSHSGKSVPFALSDELTRELKELSRQQGVTLFMTLLAGFQLVLRRYSGQENVIVGTDVANRNRLEIEELIGFFINQLVLRTDLSGNPTFRELLKRVREATLGAYVHQDVPFEKLVEEFSLDRSLARTPLFQARLLLQNVPPKNTPDRSSGLPSLTLGEFPLDDLLVKYDMTLRLFDVHDGVRGNLEYRSDLFVSGSVNWLLTLYKAVLSKLKEPESLDVHINTLMASVETPLQLMKQEQQYEVFCNGSGQSRRKQVLIG